MSNQHRRWTGNDTSHREQHERIPLAETPLLLELWWRKDHDSRPLRVGDLKLDLPALLAGRYIREDGPGHVRLRFVREDDGSISIQTRSGEPKLVVGQA